MIVHDLKLVNMLCSSMHILLPLSYILPLTYGVDIPHGAVHDDHIMPFALDFIILGAFCIGLFALSLHNIKRRWIV